MKLCVLLWILCCFYLSFNTFVIKCVPTDKPGSSQGSSSQAFLCKHDGCTHVAETPLALRHHEKKSHRPDGTQFPCSHDSYEKFCNTASGSQCHEERPAGERPLMSCGECCKKSADKPNTGTRQKTHTEGESFHCPEKGCGKSFTSKEYLLKYHKNIHTGERPFKCDFEGCNKTYANPSELRIHNIRNHLKEKPYRCKFDDCNKSFKEKNLLRDHENTHAEVKPYQCKHCGKSYAASRNLYRHIKNTHTASNTDESKPSTRRGSPSGS